jgi:hypothetical protein
MAGKELPKFDTGNTGGSSSTTNDSVYKIDVGFGLIDKDGKPLSLPPIQIGNYITALAGTDSKAYARVKAKVAALTRRSKLDPSYVGGYVSKLAQNIMGSSDIIARTGNLEDYFNTAITSSGGGSASTNAGGFISSQTQAKSDINSTFSKVLRREATDKEIKALTTVLNDAQKKNLPKYVDGVTYGGLDKEQFLIDVITSGKYDAKPTAYPGILSNLAKEVETVKGKAATAKETATTSAIQSVQSAAKANGIIVTPEEAIAYADRISNGEKIQDIAATFRKIAAISQPKAIQDLLNTGTDLATIYQPYKTAMAQTLELNPNVIDLADPALSSAITGDKTMTTYEFQRALRKDDRWQYTNNARSEAANVATQVLKDFGFMG